MYKVDITIKNQKIILLSLIKPFEYKQKSISIYDFKTGRLLYRFGKYINDFVISPDGSYLYYSEYQRSLDGKEAYYSNDQIKKINIRTGKLVCTYETIHFVDDLAISADGKTLVGLMGKRDDFYTNFHIDKKMFCVIDLEKNIFKTIDTGKNQSKETLEKLVKNDLTQSFKNRNFYNHKKIFLTNNHKILIWKNNNFLDKIDLNNGSIDKNIFKLHNFKEPDEHLISYNMIKFNKEGSLVAFTPDENTLEVWDIQNNKRIFSKLGFKSQVQQTDAQRILDEECDSQVFCEVDGLVDA